MTKQPNDTRGSLIRNTLIICLLLLSALSPSVRANASAADSVYFCMQLDTLGGIRAKQVLKLDVCSGQCPVRLGCSPGVRRQH